MRNYFAIAFTVVYLTLAVGVAKTTHYCMGREKSSHVFSFSAEKCFCSVMMQKAMPCCDDQSEIVKIEDDHSFANVIHLSSPEFNLIGEVYTLNEIVFEEEVALYTPVAQNLPPPKVPLYQSFCSLVFYDSIV